MGDEPRNAASEAGRAMSELLLDPDRIDELVAMVADDYVHQDRRRLIGLPDMDKAAWVQEGVSFLRDADVESREREVLAVRGDRLHLTRSTVRYLDGSLREFLVVGEHGGEPLQARRTVLFDLDDLDAATAELDQMYADHQPDDR